MVDSQVRTNKVTDVTLVEALEAIPREKFVPEHLSEVAYVDEDLNLGSGRSLMETMVFSRMVQYLLPLENADVLHVACGLGYGSAVLGACAKSVVGIDTVEQFVEQAQTSLQAVGADNVVVQKVESLSDGMPELSPFDAIFIEGAVPAVPTNLISQVKDGGKIIALIADEADAGAGQARGAVTLFTKSGDQISGRALFDAACPALPDFIRAKTFTF